METAHTQSPPWKVLGFRETRVVPFSSNLRGAGRQTLVSTSVNTFYQSKQRSAQSHQLQSISSPKLSKAVSSPQFLFPTALTWDLKSVPPSRPKIKRNEHKLSEDSREMQESRTANFDETFYNRKIKAEKTVSEKIEKVQDEMDRATNETLRLLNSRGQATAEFAEANEAFSNQAKAHILEHFDDGSTRQKEAELQKAEMEAKRAEAEAVVRSAVIGDELARQEKALQREVILQKISLFFSHSVTFDKFQRAMASGEVTPEARDLAARILQQQSRHFLHRLSTLKKQKLIALHKIINAWHSYLSRKLARARYEKKLELQRELAATKLQRLRRIQISRRRVNTLRRKRDRKREEVAAVTIQSRFRVMQIRRRKIELRAEAEQLQIASESIHMATDEDSLSAFNVDPGVKTDSLESKLEIQEYEQCTVQEDKATIDESKHAELSESKEQKLPAQKKTCCVLS
jgi:hypothetical protein